MVCNRRSHRLRYALSSFLFAISILAMHIFKSRDCPFVWMMLRNCGGRFGGIHVYTGCCIIKLKKNHNKYAGF